MGDRYEEGRSSEVSSPYQFRPFSQNDTYDIDTRLRMAGEIAASRNMSLSKNIMDIIAEPSNYFHNNQQSAMMLHDFQRRKQLSHETMRKAVIQQKKRRNEDLPTKIPMIEVNPTKITLSLEIELQYYRLMMSRNGDEKEDISTIMYKTNTLIQIPDKPENDSINPFVQQVTITGFYRDVERARILLRENAPMFFYIELSEAKIDLDHLLSLIQTSSIVFKNVSIEFYKQEHEMLPSKPYLKITCSSKHVNYLLEASIELISMIFNNDPPKNVFVYNCDIAAYHIEHIVGKPKNNIMLMGFIEDATNTKISHPPYHKCEDYDHNIFPITIRGDIKNVLQARQYIMELFPITLCFNLNDTDMAHPVDPGYRCMETYHQDVKVCMRITPSLMEPQELLDDEIQQHCITLRTKEFNIKALYMLYGQLLKRELKVNPPKPEMYEASIWVRDHQLDKNVMSFKLPCRGEAPLPDKNVKEISRSRVSSNSQNISRNKTASPPEGSASTSRDFTFPQMKTQNNGVVHSHMPIFDNRDVPIHQQSQVMIAPQAYQMMHQRLAMSNQMAAAKHTSMAPATLLQQPTNFMMTVLPNPTVPFYYLHDNNFVVPMALYAEEMSRIIKNGVAVTNSGIATSSAITNSTNTFNGQGGVPMTSCNNTMDRETSPMTPSNSRTSTASSQKPMCLKFNNQYYGRQYEPVKDEDIKVSQSATPSRRSSVSIEDQNTSSNYTSSNYDGYQSDRNYRRREAETFPNNYAHNKDGNHWKGGAPTASRDSFARKPSHHNNKSRCPFRDPYFNKSFPQPSNSSNSADHHFFSGTHMLKLKNRELQGSCGDCSIDQERLYTQDNSQIDERQYSPKQLYGMQQPSVQNTDIPIKLRSETVTKTILEPRVKKCCAKIKLDHKAKCSDSGTSSRSEALSSTESAKSDNKIIDFIKKVKEQAEISGGTASIPLGAMNRTYADILKEKEWERNEQLLASQEEENTDPGMYDNMRRDKYENNRGLADGGIGDSRDRRLSDRQRTVSSPLL